MALAESAVQDTQTDADQDAQAKAYGPLRDADGDVLLDRSGAPHVGTSLCRICELVKPIGSFYVRPRIGANGKEYYALASRNKCIACWNTPVSNDAAVKQRNEQIREELRYWRFLYRTSTGYLFDHAFAEQLYNIAYALERSDLRSPEGVYSQSNDDLKAMLTENEIALLRNAMFRKDQDVLYFLFDHPLQKPHGQPPVPTALIPEGAQPAPESTAGVTGEAEEVAPVLPSRGTAASDMLNDLSNGTTREKLEELTAYLVEHPLQIWPAEPAETITDEDIEAAAELIINARKRKEQLQEVIDEYTDRLRSLRQQLDETEGERQAAISLLRKA